MSAPAPRGKGRLVRLGARIGVVTSKRRAITDRCLALFELDGRFGLVVAKEDTARHKPFPDPLLFAMERAGALRDLGTLDNHWSAAAARNVVTDVDRLCSASRMSASGIASLARQLEDSATGGDQTLRSLIATHEDLVLRFRAQAALYGGGTAP